MAQLVARLVRNEKVRGSNPLSSTIKGRPRGRPFFVSSPPHGSCGVFWERRSRAP